MMRMIKSILTNLWFSDKEASIYLSWLETWLAPASTIARISWLNRVTVYWILIDLVEKWLASKQKKSSTIYFLMTSPDELVKLQKYKAKQLEEALPELMGLMNTLWNKPKMNWYNSLDWLKEIYNSMLATTENFSVFLWTKDIHPDFHHFLEHDFLPRRKQIYTKTRAIISVNSSFYADFNRDTHDSVVIKDPIFDLANEIVIYDYDKVAICLFSKEEMSATVIKSKAFHDSMLWIFDLIFKNSF